MDPTVEFLWSRRKSVRIAAADWAASMLALGASDLSGNDPDAQNYDDAEHYDSAALRQLTDRTLNTADRERLIQQVLEELGLEHLDDDVTLALAWEQESIRDYFLGALEGRALIQRGCDLYYELEDPQRAFWIRVAADAGHQGDQATFAEYDFVNGDFDAVLRAAILGSGRPLPAEIT